MRDAINRHLLFLLVFFAVFVESEQPSFARKAAPGELPITVAGCIVHPIDDDYDWMQVRQLLDQYGEELSVGGDWSNLTSFGQQVKRIYNDLVGKGMPEGAETLHRAIRLAKELQNGEINRPASQEAPAPPAPPAASPVVPPAAPPTPLALARDPLFDPAVQALPPDFIFALCVILNKPGSGQGRKAKARFEEAAHYGYIVPLETMNRIIRQAEGDSDVDWYNPDKELWRGSESPSVNNNESAAVIWVIFAILFILLFFWVIVRFPKQEESRRAEELKQQKEIRETPIPTVSTPKTTPKPDASPINLLYGFLFLLLVLASPILTPIIIVVGIPIVIVYHVIKPIVTAIIGDNDHADAKKPVATKPSPNKPEKEKISNGVTVCIAIALVLIVGWVLVKNTNTHHSSQPCDDPYDGFYDQYIPGLDQHYQP